MLQGHHRISIKEGKIERYEDSGHGRYLRKCTSISHPVFCETVPSKECPEEGDEHEKAGLLTSRSSLDGPSHRLSDSGVAIFVTRYSGATVRDLKICFLRTRFPILSRP